MKLDFNVIVFSLFAALFVWFSDAALDFFFFSGKSFWELLIVDVPEHKLFIRILILLYFFLFGSVIAAYINKQKKSNEELQDFEFRYKTIAEKTTTWEFWRNTKHGYNYVSPAFERITGYLIEDLKQNPDLIKKIIHPDDLENVLKHFEDEVKNTLETSELEFKIITQNNEVKAIKHYCQPVYDNNGKFKGTRGSNIERLERTTEHSKNISDLNQTKNDLQYSEEKFKSLFENIPDAFFLHNLKGMFIDCNSAAEKLTGYNRNELIGKNYLKLKLLSVSDAVKEVQLFAESAAGNPSGPEEFVINKKNGEKVSVEIRSFPVNIGNDTLVFSIALDITGRKLSEKALQSVATQFSTISGLKFFEQVCSHLTETLQMEYAFVGELLPEEVKVRVIAGIGKGKPLEQFDYDLADTPCENVIGKTISAYTSCVQRLFPKDILLVDMGIECYFGIPLFNSTGGALGIMVLLGTKPANDPEIITSLLQIFSERVATEMERKQVEQALQESENKYKTLFEQSADAILTIEGDKFVDCNMATVKMLGYSNKQELLNTHPSQLSPEKQPDGRNSFEKAEEMMSIAYEHGSHRFEWAHKRCNGKVFPVEVLLTSIPRGEEKFLHVVWRDITERKKAEQMLKDNEYLLKKSQRVANLGSYVLDIPAESWKSSPILDDVFGIDKTFNRNIDGWLQIIHQEDRAMMQDYFTTNVLANHESFNKEYRIKRINDKQERWVHGLGELEFDDDGSPIKMIGTIQDITSRKRKEFLQSAVYQISEASDNANSLDDLYKSVHKIIGTVMPADNFFIASYEEKEDLLRFDYFVDEVDDFQDYAKPGKGFTAYVLRTGKPLFLDEDAEEKLLSTGEVENVGTRSPIWLGVPLIIEHKVVGAMVVQHYSNPNAYSRDDLHLLEYVSSQIAKAIFSKRAEEELLKLSSAVKQSSAAIVITDTQGNFEYVNPKFTKITGYTFEEVKGKSTKILKSGESSPEMYEDLWDTITKGKEWKGEFQNKKKNGELYWDKSSISPIKDAEGSITHFLAVKEDITERKRIEKELIEAKEKAEEMNRLKSNFLANMSHELRTPLIGITGFANMLMEELNNEEDKQMADSILQSGERLTKTLDLILDLSILESDKPKVSNKKVNIVDAIDESIDTYRQVALKKGLEFNFEKNCGEIYCNVDEKLLTRVVHYLLDNSIKFTQKGSVNVKVSSNGKAAIQIADTGVGIPEEKLKLIFEPFRQASEGNTREYEGAGLGLTIAKKFIDVLGGEVTIKSEVNKGTILTIEFQEVN